jgi:decaprenyl-phosphate phosphoribosyltransferase
MKDDILHLAKALRPKHWIKNILVFALPLSAGNLLGSNWQISSLINGFIAFICLSMSSSANYIINDFLDIESDRQHPVKSKRPIATGDVSLKFGLFLAITLIVLSIMLTMLFLGSLACWAIVLFTGFQFVYSVTLKHYEGFDIVSLAVLYVARAVMPTFYEDIGISQWFFLVFFSSAMLLVCGKRYAEILNPQNDRTRKVLRNYSKEQLAAWIGISAAFLLLSYSNWILTFTNDSGFIFIFLSLIPMTIILIRLSGLIFQGNSEDTVNLVLQQKSFQILGLLWLFLYLIGKGFL